MSTTSIEKLSNELLHEIFVRAHALQWFATLPYVCRRWKPVAKNLWKKVDKIFYDASADRPSLQRVASPTGDKRIGVKLCLNDCRFVHYAYFQYPSENFFAVSDWKMRWDLFVENFFDKFEGQLKIVSCTNKHALLDGWTISSLVERNKDLHTLNIVVADGFQQISRAVSSSNLREFQYGGRLLAYYSKSDMSTMLAQIFETCKSLQFVKLNFASMKHSPDVEVFRSLATLPDLRSVTYESPLPHLIHMGSSWNIYFDTVDAVYVESLLTHLSRCRSNTLTSINLSCYITPMDLNGHNCGESLKVLAERNSIDALTLSFRPSAPTELLTALCKFRNLTVLRLHYFEYQYVDGGLNVSVALQSVASQLVVLELTSEEENCFCDEMFFENWQTTMFSLKNLTICASAKISIDQHFVPFVKKTRNLESLKFEHRPLYSLDSFEKFIASVHTAVHVCHGEEKTNEKRRLKIQVNLRRSDKMRKVAERYLKKSLNLCKLSLDSSEEKTVITINRKCP